MKKTGIIILVALIALSSMVIFITKKSGHAVGNPELISEIGRIEGLGMQPGGNISVADLQRLKELVAGDETAESHYREIEWMARNGQSEHIQHSASFLKEYVKSGEDVPCLPHELWHIALFARNGDIDYAKQEAGDIDAVYNAWMSSAEKKREQYPQFYKGFEQQKLFIESVIIRLKQGDFSNETLSRMELIGAAGIC